MRTKIAPKARARQINFRIAEALYQQIEREAKEQRRSVSAQLSFIVERALAPVEREAAGAAR